ncbi:hypothetical protein M8C21_029875, partial [Ambrosia artemisiifolia]
RERERKGERFPPTATGCATESWKHCDSDVFLARTQCSLKDGEMGCPLMVLTGGGVRVRVLHVLMLERVNGGRMNLNSDMALSIMIFLNKLSYTPLSAGLPTETTNESVGGRYNIAMAVDINPKLLTRIMCSNYQSPNSNNWVFGTIAGNLYEELKSLIWEFEYDQMKDDTFTQFLSAWSAYY